MSHEEDKGQVLGHPCVWLSFKSCLKEIHMNVLLLENVFLIFHFVLFWLHDLYFIMTVPLIYLKITDLGLREVKKSWQFFQFFIIQTLSIP